MIPVSARLRRNISAASLPLRAFVPCPQPRLSDLLEETMARLPPLVLALMCATIPCAAVSGPAVKEAEIHGVRLSYVEQGSGEPIVFVHGAFSDLRVWEPIREDVAKRYRFIAYTQRYHGVGAWNDDGKNYNTAIHVDELAKFNTKLNAGPVDLVDKYGGV